MTTKKILLILFISICSIANAQYSQLTNFTGPGTFTGAYPTYDQNLISVGNVFYGMTDVGGIPGFGNIFKINPDGTGFEQLMAFTGTNGSGPQGSFIFDGTFLYGTTSGGGTEGLGTIFKIKPDGTGYSKLFDFGTISGSNPGGSLISDGTFLYGITKNNGANSMGTIFKIKPNGTGFEKLLDFTGEANGKSPSGSLVSDGTFLYGMAISGGINNMGTLFKIKTDGTAFEKLLDFEGGTAGRDPFGSLISDGTFLYGTTSKGGTNDLGTIFKIKPNGTSFEKLWSFDGATTGATPLGSLISDGTFLYGTTSKGGMNDLGSIFKIKPDGTSFEKLWSFDGTTNGSTPMTSLISDGTFFYAMTNDGGLNNLGTIFKIKTDGTNFEKLFNFMGGINGVNPSGSLISDGTFLYGMTKEGGTYKQGTIFKIKPDGSGFAKLLDFNGATNGTFPLGTLISDGTFFYGMTSTGGINNKGTIFKIKADGTCYAKLLDFDGATNGALPMGSLIYNGTFLYGMTSEGGQNNIGVLFKIKPDGTGYSNLFNFEGEHGRNPYGSLFSDGTFLYGMTTFGGRNPNDWGTIFKINPDGTGYFKLMDFMNDTATGSYPYGDLISDGTFLYGMTSDGGNNSGTIFKIKPDGTNYFKIHDFIYSIGGVTPKGSLLFDGTFLYGMTTRGGINSHGAVFKVKPDGTDYVNLLSFEGAVSGAIPYGSLISDGTFLYGMTYYGGLMNVGTVFKLSQKEVGITENDAQTHLTIYPNPFCSITTIQTDEILKDAALTVYNLYGQEVKQLTNISGQTITLSRDNLPDGLYFVRLMQDTKIITVGKLVVADR